MAGVDQNPESYATGEPTPKVSGRDRHRRPLRLSRPRGAARRLNAIVFTAGLVGAFAIPTAMLLWVDDTRTQSAVLASLLVAIVTLIVAEHFRYYNRTPKLARLETALENGQTYTYFDRVLGYESEIAHVVACAGPGREFFLQRVEELREAAAWADLAAGQVRLSTEEEFPARIRFVELARHMVLGVSFDESAFWRSRTGRNYLDTQRREIEQRRLVVTRIFVCTEEEMLDWSDIFAAQRASGVNVLILDPANRLPTDDEDFNVYDHEVVRYAAPLDPQLPSGARAATFSVRQGDVRRYLNRFDSLQSRSDPA